MKLFTNSKVWDFIKDLVMINLGMAIYDVGWAAFLLPYHITTGGMAGMAAILQYATNGSIPMQYTILLVNAVLLAIAWWQLGWKFALKTAYAVFALSFYLEIGQNLMTDANGHLLQLLGDNQDSMACILGAVLNGIGIGIVFLSGGSTGGWDIIAALVNKFHNISLGRVLLYLDFFVIASCWPLFHDWRMVVFGYVTLAVYTFAIDMVVNSSRQDIQFTIYSFHHYEIAEKIREATGHTMTYLMGESGFQHREMRVLVTIVHKHEMVTVLRLIHTIDPEAFVTQHRVEGVYGLGFSHYKP
ncbi:MAG: YitT family protein [Bacteroidaceae bacterium]|nr:YitT family protein [Bacteroidaceae bacterium]